MLCHHQNRSKVSVFPLWPVTVEIIVMFYHLDEDSCSDSDHETVTVDQTWMGDLDSEADSLDSDQEDPLK